MELGGASGAPEAIVSDLVEAPWEDMQEESLDEVDPGDAFGVPESGVVVFVFEGDMRVVHGDDAVVGDGGSKDVSCEVA